jgi:hypothetical protein
MNLIPNTTNKVTYSKKNLGPNDMNQWLLILSKQINERKKKKKKFHTVFGLIYKQDENSSKLAKECFFFQFYIQYTTKIFKT